jgi:hypothetical protein
MRIQPFDFSVDLLQALLWQYNDATRLQTLLSRKQQWYDENQRDFWEDWTRDVFDLRTANDFGLAVWGAILDLPLVSSTTGSGAREVFGFGSYNANFFGPSGFGRDNDGTLGLTTEQKRLALRLRFFQLVTDGTVWDANNFLAALFGDQGNVYVLDNLDMTITYVFTFQPTPQVLFVLEQFDLLPRPAGVGVTVLVNPGDSFGFDPYYLNFGNGSFSKA